MVSKTIMFCDWSEHEADGELVDAQAVETINFTAPDGQDYEIDVCQAHRDEWAEISRQQQRWIKAARPVSKARARARRAASTATPAAPNPPRSRGSHESSQENTELREWARANGYQVSARGRISDELRTAYHDSLGRDSHRRWNAAAAHPRRPAHNGTPASTPSIH